MPHDTSTERGVAMFSRKPVAFAHGGGKNDEE
jgi:hypothetical protein